MNSFVPNTDKTDKPIRVVIVHYRDDATMGGSLRVGEAIANHVDPEKVEAHLIFAYGEAGPVAKSARVPCHFLKAKSPKDLSAWKRARAFFGELSPDLIHFQDAVVWLRIALLGSGYRILLHVHGRFLPEYMSWKNRMLMHAFISMTDAQICITNGARDALLGLGWTSPEKVAVVYNSVDVDKFSGLDKREEARAGLGIPEDVLLLSMVCRLVRHRGCSDAIKILTRLDRRWHLAFCGSGPIRQELEEMAKNEGVHERVHFIGLREDVRPIYAAMDAFLFLARYDSFGLATCEAMAAGIPVFGLAGEGEYQEPQYPLITSDNSVFVPRAHPADYDGLEPTETFIHLARTITEYGQHPERFSRMIENARQHVRRSFGMKLQAERMTAVYETISGRDGQRLFTPNMLPNKTPF